MLEIFNMKEIKLDFETYQAEIKNAYSEGSKEGYLNGYEALARIIHAHIENKYRESYIYRRPEGINLNDPNSNNLNNILHSISKYISETKPRSLEDQKHWDEVESWKSKK